MDDFKNNNFGIRALDEIESRREQYVAILGGFLCYGLIIWLL